LKHPRIQGKSTTNQQENEATNDEQPIQLHMLFAKHNSTKINERGPNAGYDKSAFRIRRRPKETADFHD
jgi:hypothetical protein